ATFDAYRLSSLSANFAYQNDTVRVFNAAARTPDGTTVKGHGHYGLKSQQFAAAVTGRDFPLGLLDPYTLQYAEIEGVAGFSVRADGTLKSPTVDATLALRDLSVNNQTLDSGTDDPLTVSAHYANGIVAKTGAPLEVVAHYPLTHVADGAVTTEQATTRYIVNDFSLALPTPAAPDRRALTLSAQIPETAPERLEHLEDTLRASAFAKTSVGQNILGRLDTLADSPQGTIWAPSVMVSGPLNAPRIAATVKASDLSLGDENRIDSLEVAVSPTDGAPSSNHVGIKASGLQAGGVPVNSLTAQGDFNPQLVTVQSVDVRSDQAYLHGAGTAGLGDNGQIAATLDASNVPLALFNTLSHVVPLLKPTYDSEGHQVATRRLSGEIGNLTVAVSGRTLAPDLTASLSLDQPALEVTTYSQPGDPSVTSKTPQTTRYGLDSVRSSVITVAPAKAGVADAKVLTVTDLAAYRGGKPIATLSGSLPFAWIRPAGVGLFSGLSADQPLHADLRAGDLSALAALAPDLLDPKRTGGALTASVDVRSSAEDAGGVSARVTIADASVALAGFDTYFTKINGGLTLDGEQLKVQGLTAQSSKGGTLALTGGGTVRIVTEDDGSLGVRGAPDLRLSAKDVRVEENTRQNFLSSVYGSSVRGRINGDVVITAPNDPSVAQSWLSPLISTAPGAPLLVSDTTASLPSKTAPDAAPSLAPVFDPRFALVFDLGGGKGKTTSVQNALLKADANGDVHLEGRRSAPEVRAHLTVARGQIILPPATLLRLVKPQDASANTVDLHYPYYDPTQPGSAPTMQTRVDVTGQAKVTVSPEMLAATQSTVRGGFGQSGVSSVFSPTSNFDGTGRYTIMAHIHGDLNGSDLPNLDLTSSPSGLTRPQMLASLVPAGALTNVFGGSAEKTLEKQFVLALNQIAVPTLLSPLEQGVAQSLGLTDFSVNYSPDSPVLVTLSKNLAPRLQVTYIRSIGARTPGAVNSVIAPPQYTLKLGYGLLHNFQISASTDDQRNNILALEGVFGF
ncbi:MAG: translocation/assembly module TamB domain-containing protein, partial [Armatimonadota bacterium]|nr:translocation/assembly module TamB domain-containing protein [Armatimonadota bacterium]